GSRLVSAGGGVGDTAGTARVWDVATGRPLTLALRHATNPTWAEFSADGRVLLTADGEGVARVWDATTGEPVSPALRHDGQPHIAVAFGPAGDARGGWRVLTSSRLGE